MKAPLTAAFALCLSLATSSLAAEKKPKTRTGPPSTLPPKSPLIVLPPAPDTTSKSSEPAKLISSEMSGKDLLFFTTAVDAARLQGYLVELLQTRAESEQIKAVGAALSATQDEENKQITRLAALKGWTISTEPTPAQKAIGDELGKQQASHFDKAVMDKVIEASRQSVSAYEAAAQSSDRDIKMFSEQMLPLAQEKLRLAEKMTGAGKAASQLFRTGAPPKAAPVSSPKPAPRSSPKPAPSSSPKSAPSSSPKSAPPSSPKPVPRGSGNGGQTHYV